MPFELVQPLASLHRGGMDVGHSLLDLLEPRLGSLDSPKHPSKEQSRPADQRKSERPSQQRSKGAHRSQDIAGPGATIRAEPRWWVLSTIIDKSPHLQVDPVLQLGILFV